MVVDFPARYGEPLALLETFVEQPRYRGTCYRAANWHYLGETSRGAVRSIVTTVRGVPCKAVFVLPLRGDFRRLLGVSR